ncbi:MAG: penicillin-binding protein 2 [Dehalococcoidia bacterium]
MRRPERQSSQRLQSQLTWRHWLLFGGIGLALVVSTVRLWQVQIVEHESYLEQAANTRDGAASVVAPRGTILDATGYPLAVSVDTWDVYLDSFLWRDRDQARTAAIALGAALGVDADAVFSLGTQRDSGDVPLLRHLPYEDGAALIEQGLWGVRLLPSSERVYPEGSLAGPLLGFVGLEDEGLWGVEADYDHVLSGHPGRVVDERDPLGRPIAFAPRLEQPPLPGGEVTLTIDRFIQGIAERRLDEALTDYQARSGSVVIMNPRTGAILAMASRPAVSLSPDELGRDDLDALVRNQPVTDLYEPGSVLKTLTTAAAIDLGLITPDTTYDDTGRVDVGEGRQILNWDFSANGITTMTEFLQKSLNTGAVWIAQRIGASDFYRYLHSFGIGEPTLVGLSGEAEGLVRTPEDDGWYPVDLATNSYGQGLAATPLQVLTAVNSFANGGVLMRPYVVSRIVTSDEVRTFQPVQVRQVVSPDTARTMMRMMHDVVEGVPFHRARVAGYEVAGKTGTTLVSIPTGYDIDSTIASFAGFIPYEAPAVSILVKIDQPAGDVNLGGQVAAPVFSKIAGDVMEYLAVAPTNPATVESR